MSSLDLTILGTGSPVHAPHRYGNAQVISGGGVNILVDVGWGATVRLFQSQITPQGVDAVFVTHLHSDHTTDFADLLVMGWVGGREKPLPVWGPTGTAKMVAAYRSALDEDTKFRFAHHGDKLPSIGPAAEVTEIEVGIEPQVVATIGDITVKAFEVDHRPVMPAYGFRFEREGKSIVISGDTNPCPGLSNGAKDADVLVVDSMNKKMMAQLEQRLIGIGNPKQAALLEDAHSYHASLEEGAETAQKAGVKHLVFSHVLPPITDDQVPMFIDGLDKIFTGKMTVTKDLEKFSV